MIALQQKLLSLLYCTFITNSHSTHRPFLAPSKAGSPEGKPQEFVISSLKEFMITVKRRLE